MRSEQGLHRLVNFSDAVVAIAITLLVLPLVDAASSIGTLGPGTFIDHNRPRLFAFALSFAVIGVFWWAQHQLFEFVGSYNPVLVWGMFIWLFSIVFLPFPTELLGATSRVSAAGDAIYTGTMLVTSVAAFVQVWSLVRWPELQRESKRGQVNVDSGAIILILMSSAFVLVVALPSFGLWPLLLLGLSKPLEMWQARRRRHLSTSD